MAEAVTFWGRGEPRPAFKGVGVQRHTLNSLNCDHKKASPELSHQNAKMPRVGRRLRGLAILTVVAAYGGRSERNFCKKRGVGASRNIISCPDSWLLGPCCESPDGNLAGYGLDVVMASSDMGPDRSAEASFFLTYFGVLVEASGLFPT